MVGLCRRLRQVITMLLLYSVALAVQLVAVSFVAVVHGNNNYSLTTITTTTNTATHTSTATTDTTTTSSNTSATNDATQWVPTRYSSYFGVENSTLYMTDSYQLGNTSGKNNPSNEEVLHDWVVKSTFRLSPLSGSCNSSLWTSDTRGLSIFSCDSAPNAKHKGHKNARLHLFIASTGLLDCRWLPVLWVIPQNSLGQDMSPLVLGVPPLPFDTNWHTVVVRAVRTNMATNTTTTTNYNAANTAYQVFIDGKLRTAHVDLPDLNTMLHNVQITPLTDDDALSPLPHSIMSAGLFGDQIVPHRLQGCKMGGDIVGLWPYFGDIADVRLLTGTVEETEFERVLAAPGTWASLSNCTYVMASLTDAFSPLPSQRIAATTESMVRGYLSLYSAGPDEPASVLALPSDRLVFPKHTTGAFSVSILMRLGDLIAFTYDKSSSLMILRHEQNDIVYEYDVRLYFLPAKHGLHSFYVKLIVKTWHLDYPDFVDTTRYIMDWKSFDRNRWYHFVCVFYKHNARIEVDGVVILHGLRFSPKSLLDVNTSTLISGGFVGPSSDDAVYSNGGGAMRDPKASIMPNANRLDVARLVIYEGIFTYRQSRALAVYGNVAKAPLYIWDFAAARDARPHWSRYPLAPLRVPEGSNPPKPSVFAIIVRNPLPWVDLTRNAPQNYLSFRGANRFDEIVPTRQFAMPPVNFSVELVYRRDVVAEISSNIDQSLLYFTGEAKSPFATFKSLVSVYLEKRYPDGHNFKPTYCVCTKSIMANIKMKSPSCFDCMGPEDSPRWQRLVITLSPSGCAVYLNGVLVSLRKGAKGDPTYINHDFAAVTPLKSDLPEQVHLSPDFEAESVATLSPDGTYTGDIAYFAAYRRALTAEKVRILNGLGLCDSRWPFVVSDQSEMEDSLAISCLPAYRRPSDHTDFSAASLFGITRRWLRLDSSLRGANNNDTHADQEVSPDNNTAVANDTVADSSLSNDDICNNNTECKKSWTSNLAEVPAIFLPSPIRDLQSSTLQVVFRLRNVIEPLYLATMWQPRYGSGGFRSHLSISVSNLGFSVASRRDFIAANTGTSEIANRTANIPVHIEAMQWHHVLITFLPQLRVVLDGKIVVNGNPMRDAATGVHNGGNCTQSDPKNNCVSIDAGVIGPAPSDKYKLMRLDVSVAGDIALWRLYARTFTYADTFRIAAAPDYFVKFANYSLDPRQGALRFGNGSPQQPTAWLANYPGGSARDNSVVAAKDAAVSNISSFDTDLSELTSNSVPQNLFLASPMVDVVDNTPSPNRFYSCKTESLVADLRSLGTRPSESGESYSFAAVFRVGANHELLGPLVSLKTPHEDGSAFSFGLEKGGAGEKSLLRFVISNRSAGGVEKQVYAALIPCTAIANIWYELAVIMTSTKTVAGIGGLSGSTCTTILPPLDPIILQACARSTEKPVAMSVIGHSSCRTDGGVGLMRENTPPFSVASVALGRSDTLPDTAWRFAELTATWMPGPLFNESAPFLENSPQSQGTVASVFKALQTTSTEATSSTSTTPASSTTETTSTTSTSIITTAFTTTSDVDGTITTAFTTTSDVDGTTILPPPQPIPVTVVHSTTQPQPQQQDAMSPEPFQVNIILLPLLGFVVLALLFVVVRRWRRTTRRINLSVRADDYDVLLEVIQHSRENYQEEEEEQVEGEEETTGLL